MAHAFVPYCHYPGLLMFRPSGWKSYGAADHRTLIEFVEPSVTFCVLRSNSSSAKVATGCPAHHLSFQRDSSISNCVNEGDRDGF